MQAMQHCRSHSSHAPFRPAHAKPFRSVRPKAVSKATQQHVEHTQNTKQQMLRSDRRDVLLQLTSFTAASALSGLVQPQSASAGAPPQVPQVGTYLPPSGIDDLVLFQPDARKTPALRAGTVDPNSPYKFALPPSFRCGLSCVVTPWAAQPAAGCAVCCNRQLLVTCCVLRNTMCIAMIIKQKQWQCSSMALSVPN
jgi:hypothetical protein